MGPNNAPQQQGYGPPGATPSSSSSTYSSGSNSSGSPAFQGFGGVNGTSMQNQQSAQTWPQQYQANVNLPTQQNAAWQSPWQQGGGSPMQPQLFTPMQQTTDSNNMSQWTPPGLQYPTPGQGWTPPGLHQALQQGQQGLALGLGGLPPGQQRLMDGSYFRGQR